MQFIAPFAADSGILGFRGRKIRPMIQTSGSNATWKLENVAKLFDTS